MKNIENRVTKLELQIPANDFLVVIANKGETRQSALNRTLHEIGTARSAEDFLIIFLNLYGKTS